MNTTSHFTDTARFEAALNALLENINKGIKAYWTEMKFTHIEPGEVRIENIGPKFIRLCTFERHDANSPWVCKGVHCFVNRETGNIHKAASWKAADAKAIRTNIVAPDVLNHVTPHGVSYLRGGCFDTIAGYIARTSKV